MAFYEPFGHLYHKLWSKEGPGVKLAIWLSTTKSRKSTRFRCVQVECDTSLESSQGELKLWLRPCPNLSLGRGVMSVQSPRSPNQDSFRTTLWESREKEPFGCKSRGELQRILYGGRWWLPSNPGHGESNESKLTRGLSQHQKRAEWVLTHLWVGFGCRTVQLSKLVLLPNLSWSFHHAPLTPLFVLKARSMPWIPEIPQLEWISPTWG